MIVRFAGGELADQGLGHVLRRVHRLKRGARLVAYRTDQSAVYGKFSEACRQAVVDRRLDGASALDGQVEQIAASTPDSVQSVHLIPVYVVVGVADRFGDIGHPWRNVAGWLIANPCATLANRQDPRGLYRYQLFGLRCQSTAATHTNGNGCHVTV
ncbi:hypothetical protein D3C78_1221200 [compost metagenome]